MTATRIEIGDGVSAWLDDVPLTGGAVWVVTSDGLRTWGHPEIVLPVLAHPQLDRAATARTLGQVIGAIAQAARSGSRVDAGGVTRFGGAVLGFDGVAYLPPTPIGAMHLPPTSLVGLFAASGELDGIERFGARRFASLIARQTRMYPYPPWTDLTRPRLAVGTWPSVLANMPAANLPGATVTQEGGALHFRLGRGRSGAMLRAMLPRLPAATPPTFTLHAVSPTADACLVWAPGQQEAAAVAPPGSRGERVGGCFLGLANQQAANASQVVEDGFAYFLRDADYARVRGALEGGTDLVIHGARRGDDLYVTWVDDGGAAQPPAAPRARVQLVSVQLLVEPKDGGTAVAQYLKALTAAVDRTLPSMGTAYEVMIEVRSTARPAVRIATRPVTPPDDAMQRCYDELDAVPFPRVGELAFQAHLVVDG